VGQQGLVRKTYFLQHTPREIIIRRSPVRSRPPLPTKSIIKTDFALRAGEDFSPWVTN
jgi:hypothetical protein